MENSTNREPPSVLRQCCQWSVSSQSVMQQQLPFPRTHQDIRFVVDIDYSSGHEVVKLFPVQVLARFRNNDELVRVRPLGQDYDRLVVPLGQVKSFDLGLYRDFYDQTAESGPDYDPFCYEALEEIFERNYTVEMEPPPGHQISVDDLYWEDLAVIHVYDPNNPSYFSLPSDASKKLRNPSSCKWSDHHSKKHVLSPSNKIKGLSNVTKKGASSQMQCAIQSLNRARSEDRNWFILGKPRPEDIAPSFCSGRYHHQRHNSTGNMNRSYNLLHQDMIHCKGDEEVAFFAGGNNTQYYNTAAVPPNRIFPMERRRHSMESFLNRDKIFMVGSENDAKNRDVSSTRTFKETKMLTKAAGGGSKMGADELDVLLVSCGESESATLWVNYLISCFQQISRERNNSTLRLQNIKLEDTLSSSTGAESFSEQFPGVHLRIVVICPLFLQKVLGATSIKESILAKILQPDHMLVMILGLQDHAENRLRSVFPEYDQWRKMNMKDQDPTFVGDFLGISMDILSRSRHLQEGINQEEESSGFSIVPKKIKVSQNKLIIFLTEALAAEDVIKVSVFRNHNRIEITNAKRRNPYAIQFTMPACCFQVSMLVSVCVEKNGKSLGQRMVKCESKMRELELLILSLDNPIQFLCQCFGLNTRNKEQLDTFLVQNFQKNTPRNFNVLGPWSPPFEGHICNEEFPTLLHFSAKYGLEKLTLKLLGSPGGDKACRIRNSSHYTPAEMAEKANHSKLANALQRNKEMIEFARLCNDTRRMSMNEREFAQHNYLLPKPLDDTYLIPPNARPVDIHAVLQPDTTAPPPFPYYANFKHCDFSPSHTMSAVSTSTSSPVLTSVLDNYDVPLNGLPYTPPIPSTPHSPAERGLESYSDLSFAGSELTYSNSLNKSSYFEVPEKFRSLNRSKRASTLSDPCRSSECSSTHQLSHKEKLSPDDELLEIIRDFKNNVFTISEVEILVQNWQSRNDVQQSFREKKEQLTEMREEYDRVQRKMTDQMKRTTLFNRMCKLFSHQSKRKRTESEKSGKGPKSEITGTEYQRPNTLNLRSSSHDCLEVNSISDRSHVSDQYVPVGQNVNKLYANDKISVEETTNKWKMNSHNQFLHQPPKFLYSNITSEDLYKCAQSDCLTSTEVDLNLENSDGSERKGAVRKCDEYKEREILKPICGYPLNNDDEEVQKCFQASTRKAQINKYRKSSSLELKKKPEVDSNVRNRVKSSENILTDRVSVSPSLGKSGPRNYPFSHRRISLDYEPLTDLPASADDVFITKPVKRSSSQVDMPTVDDNSKSVLTNEINSVSSSDCESNDNSSCRSTPPLDLSSLSLADSTGAFDENDELDDFVDDNETDSFHLNIFEEGDTETETAPSLIRTTSQPTYINICNMGFPDYVNVAIV